MNTGERMKATYERLGEPESKYEMEKRWVENNRERKREIWRNYYQRNKAAILAARKKQYGATK